MSSDWNPGDVAMVTDQSGVGACRALLNEDGEWRCTDNDLIAPEYANLRPLVVIDPEDREQVERLTLAFLDRWYRVKDEKFDAMQTALRSHTDPPKPPEPTGLGAVVEAVCECRPEPYPFIREELTGDFPEAPWKSGCGHHEWSDLTNIRELAVGVTP